MYIEYTLTLPNYLNIAINRYIYIIPTYREAKLKLKNNY